MDKKMSVEDLKFIMQRIDLNIDRTNTKATILIGGITFALGAIADNLSDIKLIMSYGCIYYTLINISLFGLAISIYYSIAAIVPIFPKKDNQGNMNTSLIYYGSICNLQKEEYLVKAESDLYSFKDDLSKQIVENSSIAYSKFIKLEKAFRYLIFMVIIPWILTLSMLLIGGKL